LYLKYWREKMFKRMGLVLFLLAAFTVLSIPKVFAENLLSQYGEISNIYNDEIKIRCKDSLSGDIYYFKFYIGWDTVFEGVDGKSGLNIGDYINVTYKLDLSQKPVATKVSLPKELTSKIVSRSGLQTNDTDNKDISDLKNEIEKIWAEINQIKGQLSQGEAR